jgi:predicted nuclease of restriction endonuclease-like (RecB) superfamily
MKKVKKIDDIELLANAIGTVDEQFHNIASKQVNYVLTMRNWFIGYYIFNYEQNGQDRAAYGEKVLSKLAAILKKKKLKGFSHTSLKLFRTLFVTYPEIGQTASDQFKIPKIGQTVSDQFKITGKPLLSLVNDTSTVLPAMKKYYTKPEILINHLSFSHIIELLKIDTEIKRFFYETEAIKNNWSVRDLQRAMNSLLYERTGLSKNKKSVISRAKKDSGIQVDSIFKSPYILEFLRIEEKAEFNESDIEQAIITHMQKFLMELGRGFCFESRQKRITFDNTHYYIDLVFYHRILKCHVLIDLKLGEFTHADAGQMNLYLNYFKENELEKGDNNPIGIIMCAGNNEQLVKYATGGLTQKVFVSKYMINLPKEEELKKIIIEEQKKWNIPKYAK